MRVGEREDQLEKQHKRQEYETARRFVNSREFQL